MKTEIEQILEMHKTGSLTSEQAATLIREVQPARGPSKSLTETLMDKLCSLSGHLQLKPDGENSSAASDIRPPSGSEYEYRGNRFTTSHVEALHFHQSRFENNKTVNTHLQKVVLDNSSVETSSFVNTHAEDFKLDHSEVEGLIVHHTELKRVKLSDESTVRQFKIQSSSVQELELDQESELSDGECSMSKVKKLKLEQSSWMGMTVRSSRLKEVELVKSHLTDTIITSDQKWRKSDFQEVKFENVFLKKAIFSNCRLENVVFKNVTQENVHFSGLHLKDVTVDGDAAFLDLTSGR